MIAHILGANPRDRAGVRAVVRMGFWAVLIMSLPLMGLLLFTTPILLALGQRPELAAGAGQFTAALCFGLPFSLGYQVLRNFSTALVAADRVADRDGAPASRSTASGDYALIFGHFGMPRLGLTGLGIASACSYAFSFLAMLAVVLADAEAARVSHLPPLPQAALGEAGGGVPARHADRADHDVRGDAVQLGDADHGHVRRCDGRRAPDRA